MTTDRTGVEKARADLAATIDAIQYKVNVPARALPVFAFTGLRGRLSV